MKINTHRIQLDSQEFEDTVNFIVKEYNIQEIIETGTFLGTGSTMAFAKTGLPVLTLECDEGNADKAAENLKAYPNVDVIHGLSLPVDVMYEAIVSMSAKKFPEHIRHDVTEPTTFYLGEIDHETNHPDFLMTLIGDHCAPVNQLIFLDSSGGIGMAEVDLVLEYKLGKPAVLMLDDIDHVKHYYSRKVLVALGLEMNMSSDGRFGWCYLGNDDSWIEQENQGHAK